ncbi:MAG TPA: amino acid ABC transporter permease [Acidimicrobiales bacterium]|nr:amino acid ABC transporter permease [Acidimicrobiales bacterium]
MDVFVQGIRTTVGLTLLSFTFALLLGTIVAACRVSPVPPLRLFGVTWVELFRNTPLTLMMLLFFFGFTKVGIGPFEPFPSAVIVLSVYTSAFVAETVRSGINTVAGGQGEAARAIGLTFAQTMRLVVLPQAFRTVVAPLGSLFIALTKNTSIASVIAVPELSKLADNLNTDTARPLPVFAGAAIGYLILTMPSGFLVGILERRVAIKR